MKKTKILSVFLLLLLILITASACKRSKSKGALSGEAQKICGSWAYNHEKEKAVAVFHEDGNAEYEGKKYTFECDNEFIHMKDHDGDELQIRYVKDKDGIYLYTKKTYSFNGDEEPDGLIGEWICAETNWSFYFSTAGTFLEDGYFPGYYTVDKEKSTIKLKYTETFEDTLCYYQLNGKELTIEYPWRMVPTSAE